MKIKGNIRPIALALALGAILAGCKATPDVIEPVPFSNQNSAALNIANQTALTKDQSPLRDYTVQEVQNAEVSLEQHYGGNKPIILGALKLATLDLTGVIDVAGGSMANLAQSNHIASKPRWFVALPKVQFQSKNEAIDFARHSIREAQIKAYSTYGNVKVETNPKNSATYLSLEINGKVTPIGGVYNEQLQPTVIESKFSGVDSYLMGFDGNMYTGFISVTGALIAELENDSVEISPTVVYQTITNELPENFFIYMPSFGQFHGQGKVYTDYSHVVPSIYTQGKKLQFIKPE